MLSSMSKLAIFDIDGTIAVKGQVPSSVVEGFLHIQELGFLTTVSTGRSYVRARHALAENFDTIVSPDSFIIVEAGAKIVDREGTVVKADYFKTNELDHIIDFSRVNADMIRLIWFTPPDISVPIQLWCKYPEDIGPETEKRGHSAEIFHSTFDELRERFDAFPISNISVKLEPFISVENLKLHFTRSEVDLTFQDGMMEYIRNIADKAKAILYLEEHFGVSIANMLVAGNAINDVDMLNLPAGHRILVGTGPATDIVMGHLRNPDEIIRVDSPEELGVYLQRFEG
jgi:HAD superfamily hydrolase (TIGR01484 family)